MQLALLDRRFAVVRGASHVVPMEGAELVNRLILDFLAADQVEALHALPGCADPR